MADNIFFHTLKAEDTDPIGERTDLAETCNPAGEYMYNYVSDVI